MPKSNSKQSAERSVPQAPKAPRQRARSIKSADKVNAAKNDAQDDSPLKKKGPQKQTKSKSEADAKASDAPRSNLKRESILAVDQAEKQTPNADDRKHAKNKGGRPVGTGKYGETTKVVRIPLSMVESVLDFVARKGLRVRLYDVRVQAGFPSPAFDAPFETLDVAQYLVPNPASTFFVKVTGESMRDAGIFPDDVLIVDRSEEPRNGDVVVAAVDGEFTVKRLYKTGQEVELRPENRRFAPIKITEETNLIVWGVVKKVIHNV